MIGWENDRGAYYINKLREQLDSTIEDVGSLTDLQTPDKADIVSAMNSVNSLLGGAMIVNFGTIGGGKKLVLTNKGTEHIELLLLAHGVASAVHYVGLGTLSGSSSASIITPVGTSGTSMSASASGKTITLTNSGNTNTRCYGIIFNYGSKVNYSIESV